VRTSLRLSPTTTPSLQAGRGASVQRAPAPIALTAARCRTAGQPDRASRLRRKPTTANVSGHRLLIRASRQREHSPPLGHPPQESGLILPKHNPIHAEPRGHRKKATVVEVGQRVGGDCTPGPCAARRHSVAHRHLGGIPRKPWDRRSTGPPLALEHNRGSSIHETPASYRTGYRFFGRVFS